jgi:hypothetical protein
VLFLHKQRRRSHSPEATRARYSGGFEAPAGPASAGGPEWRRTGSTEPQWIATTGASTLSAQGSSSANADSSSRKAQSSLEPWLLSERECGGYGDLAAADHSADRTPLSASRPLALAPPAFFHAADGVAARGQLGGGPGSNDAAEWDGRGSTAVAEEVRDEFRWGEHEAGGGAKPRQPRQEDKGTWGPSGYGVPLRLRFANPALTVERGENGPDEGVASRGEHGGGEDGGVMAPLRQLRGSAADAAVVPASTEEGSVARRKVFALSHVCHIYLACGERRAAQGVCVSCLSCLLPATDL